MVPGARGKPEAKVKSWEERFARQFRTGVRCRLFHDLPHTEKQYLSIFVPSIMT